MGRYRVELSEPAQNDLRDMLRYISAEIGAPSSALHVLNAMEEALSGLAEMPRKYAVVSDELLAAIGYRKLVVKNYIAFFTIDEGNMAVDVERILYNRRDWKRIL